MWVICECVCSLYNWEYGKFCYGLICRVRFACEHELICNRKLTWKIVWWEKGELNVIMSTECKHRTSGYRFDEWRWARRFLGENWSLLRKICWKRTSIDWSSRVDQIVRYSISSESSPHSRWKVSTANWAEFGADRTAWLNSNLCHNKS